MSCAGEGFGHVSRLISFAQGLKRRHELILFVPSSVQHHIRRNLPDAHVVTIPYFHLVKCEDRIDYLATAKQNIAKAIRFRADVSAIRRTLASCGAAAIISDYDPYLPAAARSLDLPVLQINHPSIVTKSPSMLPDALVAKAIARAMTGPSDRRLLVSFYNGDIGPILREELTKHPTVHGDYFVVYVKPTYRRRVVGELTRLGVPYRLFPNPREDYAQALAGCRGLITGAGHQSLSEAVTLGKPVFAIPQRGQYEQRLNARMLVESGWGMKGRFSNLNKTLPAFIRHVDRIAGATATASSSEPDGRSRPSREYRGPGGSRFRFINDRDLAVRHIESFLAEYSGAGPVKRILLNFQHTMAETFSGHRHAG
ncbi:MAG: glycosyltransferase family protein [Spirochaetales bacterium]